MRWPWPVAVGTSVLTGAVVLAGVVLAGVAATRSTVALAAVGGAVAVVVAALGVLVGHRLRDNVVSVLLASVGLALAFTCTREIGWVVLARNADALHSLAWLVAILEESSVWLFVAFALLLLYFPDGHVPGPGWRWVPGVLIAAGVVVNAYGAFDPAPFRPPLEQLPRPFPRPPVVFDLLYIAAELAVLTLVIACAFSLVARFRGVGPQTRQQLKWVAVAGLGVPAFLLVCLGEVIVLGHPGWVSVAVAVATIVGVPAAISIAMLRRDLFDIDRALATAIAYTVATSVLLAIFVLSSLAVGLLFGQGSAAVAAATTAVVAVALAPLRRGLQDRVDARLYPLRRAAFATIEELQQSIHAGRAEPEQLEERLRVALRDPALRVAYVMPAGQLFDASGTPVGSEGSTPVMTGSTVVGALLPGGRPLSPALLRDVAAASATLVELVRLRLELRAALRAVRASRARLVQTGDMERRRLERDLHDGAQQRLVSLGMALRVAQRHLGDGTTDLDALIDHTVAELGTAVGELRQIAHGLRPSSLDDGLDAALTALTQHVPVPVAIDLTIDPLPDELTTTLYYVASEAITNAVKHADPSRIDVTATRCNGTVTIWISDNGRGGATLTTGSGLAGLSDRVRALGGELSLDSTPGCGTVVQAVLPCAS